MSKLAVIKLGGHAMDDENLLASFLADVVSLRQEDWQFVIVHGGGPHINALLRQLSLESEFVNGLRVTTPEILAAVEMALCARVNKDITRRLLRSGVDAVGISGQDAHLLQGRIKDPALGLVGTVTKVDGRILRLLLDGRICPIVAPVALSEAFEPLNVNADTAAGAIAGALEADYFVLLSDVPGVLDATGELLPRLNGQDTEKLRRDAVITGGMIPKVECCQAALARGCASALILDGRRAHALAAHLRDGLGHGTEILP